MLTPFLTTPRLSLCYFTAPSPTTPNYPKLLFNLDADPRVTEFINGSQPPDFEKYPPAVERYIQQYQENPNLGFFAVHLNSNEQFIGWAHLKPGNLNPDEIELGYRLKSQHWNHGYATELSLTLLAHAFNTLNLSQVSATTLTRNTASRRVMEKIGMTLSDHFIYPQELLPFWNKTNRQAVKYTISALKYHTQSNS